MPEPQEKIPLEPGDVVVRWMELDSWRAAGPERTRYEWQVERYEADRQLAHVRRGQERRSFPVRLLAYVGRAHDT
ncbi:MAG: hypothetical protein N2561_00180 [Bacteroidetes bacterium]|nr:hypothetical protein [Rhodothermia bacterium]MCS7155938.1 hypothetical protein [Bacteroidota bacterium]MCX7905944.1 hypothetical protein [Bacteroidota bacterium]MDW8138089.1 hypothetical protein [Bacteroidota bacterium]MDW8285773.1 hypothetical protein [Bacteroidota bacterium]